MESLLIGRLKRLTALESDQQVTYNVEAVQDELRVLQEELARAKREAVSSPVPSNTIVVPLEFLR